MPGEDMTWFRTANNLALPKTGPRSHRRHVIDVHCTASFNNRVFLILFLQSKCFSFLNLDISNC